MSAALIPHPQEIRSIEIPRDSKEVELTVGRRNVRLTGLQKILWPQIGATKRDLLQYYIDTAAALFPHVSDRAIVMKRYTNGAAGGCYFMKRAPASRPEWIETCALEQAPGHVVEFPVVHDLASLLWIVNLGCIELNHWPATCDDVQRPDSLHFDLDPTPGASFQQVLDTALLVRDALHQLEIHSYPKTSGSRGMHIYVPIVRGPLQKDVFRFTRALAKGLEAQHPDLITSESHVKKRPRGRVVVDYSRNAWGGTLASVYSVRPAPAATVSTPLTWEEVERGIRAEHLRMDNVAERVRTLGDLWKPMLAQRGRLRLDRLLG